jgi:hypothetical protein
VTVSNDTDLVKRATAQGLDAVRPDEIPERLHS